MHQYTLMDNKWDGMKLCVTGLVKQDKFIVAWISELDMLGQFVCINMPYT